MPKDAELKEYENADATVRLDQALTIDRTAQNSMGYFMNTIVKASYTHRHSKSDQSQTRKHLESMFLRTVVLS